MGESCDGFIGICDWFGEVATQYAVIETKVETVAIDAHQEQMLCGEAVQMLAAPA